MELTINDINTLFKRRWIGENIIDGKTINQYKHYISLKLNRIVLSVDYSNTNYFVDTYDGNGQIGVLENRNGEIYWSWQNTLNTHYTAFFYYIMFLNKKLNRTYFTTFSLLSTNVLKTVDLILRLVEEHKQEIFTPGSSVYDDIFFATQWSWNKGTISNLRTSKYISPYFEVETETLKFQRGSNEDFSGIDYLIKNEDGKFLTVQHKSSKLELCTDYYNSQSINYDKKHYKKINILSIDDIDYIYVFKNVDDNELIGMHGGYFFVHESLLLLKIKKMDEKLYEYLEEINNLCCNELRYVFNLNRIENDVKNNYILEPGSLTINLNNDIDSNLEYMFSEILEILNNKKEIPN